MIEYIKGILADLTPTYAVIEAAGVGYAIHIALPSYSAMVGLENTETKLFVTEIIREDTHDLYGFFSRGERELFVMLMTVSGIGANTARMIMSAYTAAEIRQIIATGNARALSQVKGLGPKFAPFEHAVTTNTHINTNSNQPNSSAFSPINATISP